MRLDNYIYNQGLSNSRNKAKELIKNKQVKVDGVLIDKPSFEVKDVEIEILQDIVYVSRAGYKLDGFLKGYQVDIKEKECLDIGSSTGGFVEVLLSKGAKSVTAVDVGSNQLHKSLRENPKIKLYENTNIRDFKTKKSFEVVTCDVSFIGVSNITDDIDRVSSKDIIILFKPQFEVGKDVKRDKKGVVKDKKAIERVMMSFESLVFKLGWTLVKKEESSLRGKDGNVEIFYHFKK
jgi:23S rRNA (cytidine1920-2'-O)/16S rRNA (cytidine1409-2'-O)-methyltransferase